ncbi:MAG TPA: ATP-binding domain-containing protein, partial [Hanamia sp.]|nr:ATP-binding domain-containing protein [Hanamia sp.]
VLALKAAIAHLRNPNAVIVYTFYTKSLYQYIQRLITRFYRQYDDKDPDWGKLKILHAWGGISNPGIYYEACERHQSYYYNFELAAQNDRSYPFNFACAELLKSELTPMYDYIFIDEGQDFPISFLKLCLRLADKGKIVWAYDELQTIFQTKTPDISEVLDKSEYKGLEEDIILYKCYRNPREILIAAHAIGFGLYGKRIVQMIENKEYWQDIGYKVIEGEFKEGQRIVIERPQENSLETISKFFKKNEIVKFHVSDSVIEEVQQTVRNIEDDLEQGLLPDDILVIVLDDRNAKDYLSGIQKILASKNIKSNNIHSDKFNLKDFSLPNHVTLSTVHKAKGNENYSVHIMGIDALYALDPTIRQRNLMFTAMTRAKGWISLTGTGRNANLWCKEIITALSKFPNLEFTFPSSHELKIMKRDIKENAVRKSRQAKMLDDLLTEMSPEEIKQFLVQREVKKKK